jgi:hypothetical protein
MRRRRAKAARWARTARLRRALAVGFLLVGMLVWLVAALSLLPFPPALGVIAGGVVVVAGVILIATSV